jgi:hypothetical protein
MPFGGIDELRFLNSPHVIAANLLSGDRVVNFLPNRTWKGKLKRFDNITSTGSVNGKKTSIEPVEMRFCGNIIPSPVPKEIPDTTIRE